MQEILAEKNLSKKVYFFNFKFTGAKFLTHFNTEAKLQHISKVNFKW